MLVEDTTALIVQIPIRLRDLRYLQQGQQLELQLVDRQATAQATVLEIGKRVEIISFEQVVIVKALVTQSAEQSAAMFSPGAPVRCRVVCERVRLLEYLRRSIRWQL